LKGVIPLRRIPYNSNLKTIISPDPSLEKRGVI